jgi:hypothetical protein
MRCRAVRPFAKEANVPRFHFNLREGGKLLPDDEGAEYETLEAAYLEAFAGAHEMWITKLRQRANPLRCAFEITDHAGKLLVTLPFEEVLESFAGAPARLRPGRTFSSALATVAHAQRLRQEMSGAIRAVQQNLETTRRLLAGSQS